MSESTSFFCYDDTQRAVIEFSQGSAIVLAAPGCGKTFLLTSRIVRAHRDKGVAYKDMLCVTFTNRAARSMRERIQAEFGGIPEGLFVGNLHRFCIHFLFENSILSDDTVILDELDQEEVINSIFFPEDEEECSGRTSKPWEIRKTIDAAGHIFEKENEFPPDLQLHRNFDVQFLTAGQKYIAYKRAHKCVDFDDLLRLTYQALRQENYRQLKYSSYDWIQVDEVQDLNPLQLAIVERLAADENSVVLYLGDERQAIYSFMGTKAHSVFDLSQRTGGRIFHLGNNYRSPKYLLDLLNDYAHHVLGVDKKRLPVAYNNEHIDDGLSLVRCNHREQQAELLAAMALRLSRQATDESIGILTRTNQEAEEISAALDHQSLRHLTITKRDLFKGVAFKTLYSHFSVVCNDAHLNDWTRLLYATRVIEKVSHARRFMHKLKEIGMTPTDFIDYDGSSYCLEVEKSYTTREIVVFDTETTGLNIFADDIIQIAAVKMLNGNIVEGSGLDLIIETDREIPPMLGDTVNPMVEEYRRRERVSAEVGFTCFLHYIGGAELVGHNVAYDLHMLLNNLARRTPHLTFSPRPVWDTLKLSRLLDPSLQQYKLGQLLIAYGLEGKNSHNALDDIRATCALLRHCYTRILERKTAQLAFIDNNWTKKMRQRLLNNYAPLYQETLAKLYDPRQDEAYTLHAEMKNIYTKMRQNNFIDEIPLFAYLYELIRTNVVNPEDHTFNQQLTHSLYDLRTFNETDLFENQIIRERIFVMTVHKAKGLEFDHVLVHNVSEGAYPHFYSRGNEITEEARVLYVAFSRAKQTLGLTYAHKLSPFIKSHPEVYDQFRELSAEEIKDLSQDLT